MPGQSWGLSWGGQIPGDSWGALGMLGTRSALVGDDACSRDAGDDAYSRVAEDRVLSAQPISMQSAAPGSAAPCASFLKRPRVSRRSGTTSNHSALTCSSRRIKVDKKLSKRALFYRNRPKKHF